MGNLAPVALTALQAFQAVNTAASAVGRGIDFFDNSAEKRSKQQIAHLQQLQDARLQDAQERAALNKRELSIKSQKVEAQKRAALKRAIARRRANFGASGVSAGDGSSEAVLLGLFDESEQDRALRDSIDNLKQQSINQGLTHQARVNTLERTQLAEREKLKNYTSPLKRATDFFSIFE